MPPKLLPREIELSFDVRVLLSDELADRIEAEISRPYDSNAPTPAMDEAFDEARRLVAIKDERVSEIVLSDPEADLHDRRRTE